MLRIAAASIALLAFATSARSQQPVFQDELLDHLAGKWILQGIMHGANTTHDVTAEWVLGHQYLKVHEISREKDAKGQPAYVADVYIGWDQPNSQYSCVWLDVYGGVLPASIGHARRSGNEIPFLFKDKGSLFHTTFKYIPASNVWEWRMDNDLNGTLKPFARVTLTRVN